MPLRERSGYPIARKRQLHLASAAWFETRDPTLRAEHLDRAEDPAAAQAYLGAARAQVADYRFERASQMVERGLEIAGDRATMHELTCFQGEILRDLGDIEKSIDAFNAALESADDDAGRCRAWIGLAAGMRVVDRFDDALEVLQLAEAAAGAHVLAAERAHIHFYRGNIYFPLGNIDGCLEQHELARKAAREAGTPEDEARALSGLADAYYLRGRMITAHDHFHQCIELCRENGFGRIEVANLQMRGRTRYFQNLLKAAVKDSLTGAEAAAKVAHHRAELVARQVTGFTLFDMAELAAAKEQCEQALALARRLGARRFETANLQYLARILAVEGRRSEAVKLMEEAFSISRETAIKFAGAWTLGALAVVTDDPATRKRALEDGERILRSDCVSHNYLHFYRDAIDACPDSEDWDGVGRYAAALEAYTRPEPLPWSDLFIARGRVLAAIGRGKGDDATMAELRRLRDEADRAGLKSAIPALDAALGAE